MVSWDPAKLSWQIGDAVIKRFHLTDEKDRNRLGLKNIARLTDRGLDVDYFDYNFKIRFEDDNERHLIVEVSSLNKGLEEIAGYVGSQVSTGSVFRDGFLKSIGERSDFKEYASRLEYIGMQETESEYASRIELPLLRISYRIKDSLTKLDLTSFLTTVLNYSVLPFLAFALNTREEIKR